MEIDKCCRHPSVLCPLRREFHRWLNDFSGGRFVKVTTRLITADNQVIFAHLYDVRISLGRGDHRAHIVWCPNAAGNEIRGDGTYRGRNLSPTSIQLVRNTIHVGSTDTRIIECRKK